MELSALILGSLAVWRVTHFFHAEDGPFDVVARLRAAAGAGPFGRLMDCFYCLSIWIAAPFAWLLGEGVRDRALLWLALSGAAGLLERATARGGRSAAAPGDLTEESTHGLLRTESGARDARGPASGGESGR